MKIKRNRNRNRTVGALLFLSIFILAGCGQQQTNLIKDNKTVLAKAGENEQQKYDVLNWMSSASISVGHCMSEKKEVLSGIGGEKICDIAVGTWPIIKICGDSPSDTKWIIANSGSSSWSITLNCSEYANCNGQVNAVCDDSGCTFNKGCNPQKK
jgi:hypothetical protein